jgi:hypothetical protein
VDCLHPLFFLTKQAPKAFPVQRSYIPKDCTVPISIRIRILYFPYKNPLFQRRPNGAITGVPSCVIKRTMKSNQSCCLRPWNVRELREEENLDFGSSPARLHVNVITTVLRWLVKVLSWNTRCSNTKVIIFLFYYPCISSVLFLSSIRL